MILNNLVKLFYFICILFHTAALFIHLSNHIKASRILQVRYLAIILVRFIKILFSMFSQFVVGTLKTFYIYYLLNLLI